MSLERFLKPRLLRALAIVAGATGLAMCVDATGPGSGRPVRASFAFAPVFSPSTSRAAAILAAEGEAYDRVRVEIKRPGTNEVLKDTTVTFLFGDTAKVLEVVVTAIPEEVLSAGMQYKLGDVVNFEGTANVKAVPLSTPSSSVPAVEIVIKFTGSGAKAKTVSVSPASGTFPTTGTIQFSAVVRDSADALIDKALVTWKVSDATIGRIDSLTGLFTPTGKRGPLVVSASTLQDAPIVGNATISLLPPPAKIVVVSGDDQTGLATGEAAQPLVVAVLGADDIGLANQTVTFAATDGGTITPTSATTDANGRASATIKFGNRTGLYNFTASSGTFSVGAKATASRGPAAQMTAVGSLSFTVTSGVAPTNASKVLITDAGGNPVPDVPVTVDVAIQGTTQQQLNLTSDADGLVTMPAALALTAKAGVFTAKIANANLTGSPITFTVTVVPGAPAKMAFVVPPSANVSDGTIFAAQPVVQLLDVNANPTPAGGVAVAAAITAGGGTLNGTTTATTDANGQAKFTNLSITGTAGSKTLTFSTSGVTSLQANITLVGGAAVTMAASAGNNQTAVVATTLPVAPTVKILDRSGNPVAGVTVQFAVTGGGGFVTGPSMVTDASGQAKPGAWKLGPIAGNQMLTATATDPSGSGIIIIAGTGGTISIAEIVGNPVVFVATGTPAAASRLVVARPPNTSAVDRVIWPVQPAIALADEFGNRVAEAGVVVTASLVVGDGALDGTVTATTDAAGVATFTNLSIAGPAGPKTIQFAATGMTSTTVGLQLTAGAAVTMAIDAGNGQTAASGSPTAVVPSVKIVDRDGNGVPGINVVFAATGGGGVVHSPNAVTNAQGIAKPGSWVLGVVNGPNILTARPVAPIGGGVIILAGTGGTISIDEISGNPVVFSATGVSGPAARLGFAVAQPGNLRNKLSFAPQPVVQIQDAFGNPVSQSGTEITATLTFGSATLDGTATATTNAQGAAAFTNLSVRTTVSAPVTISYTASGLTKIDASSTVTGGIPTAIVLSGPGNLSGVTGSTLSARPTVKVVDADNLGVAGVPVDFTVTGGNGSVSPSATTTAITGLASTTWTLGNQPGLQSLKAVARADSGTSIGFIGGTGGTLEGSFSGNPVLFNAVALSGIPAKIERVSASDLSVNVGMTVEPPAVRVTDANGNPVAGVKVAFAVTGGQGQITGPATVLTNTNGVARVQAWKPALGLNVVTATAVADSLAPIGITGGTGGGVTVDGIAGNPVRFQSHGLPVVEVTSGPPASSPIDAPTTSPTILVKDSNGNPIPGATVTFAVVRGGGSVTGGTVTTGANGLASPTAWTLGPTPTANVVEARINGTPFVAFTVNGTLARRLFVGETTVCALSSSTYCWGENSTNFQQYGAHPTTIPQSTSPVVAAPTGISRMTSGNSDHMCGITSSSAAICWGRGTFGELGEDSTTSGIGTVAGGIQWADLSTSKLTTCGVSTSGVGYCWGNNQSGEIGNSSIPVVSAPNKVPVPIEGGHSFKSGVGGWTHACGIVADGSVYCWGAGSNALGLGSDAPGTQRTPVKISSDEKFMQLSLAGRSTCGLTTDGRAFCWGVNATGQLGDGTTTDRNVPTPVAGGLRFTSIMTSTGFPTGSGATLPSVTGQAVIGSTCALTETGQAYCWGWNGAGQLGDGTTTDQLVPTAVAGTARFSVIGVGGAMACGMRAGTVSCWGGNALGQLGIGSTTNSSTPVTVLAPFGAGAPAPPPGGSDFR
jgi:alpha-tubulin suppressor-like RCC1 family protein